MCFGVGVNYGLVQLDQFICEPFSDFAAVLLHRMIDSPLAMSSLAALHITTAFCLLLL